MAFKVKHHHPHQNNITLYPYITQVAKNFGPKKKYKDPSSTALDWSAKVILKGCVIYRVRVSEPVLTFSVSCLEHLTVCCLEWGVNLEMV